MKLYDHGYGASASHGVPVYLPVYVLHRLLGDIEAMCVNILPEVALVSAVVEIGPTISGRKSSALATTPPSHKIVQKDDNT